MSRSRCRSESASSDIDPAMMSAPGAPYPRGHSEEHSHSEELSSDVPGALRPRHRVPRGDAAPPPRLPACGGETGARFTYALAAAHARAGNCPEALRYIHEAREKDRAILMRRVRDGPAPTVLINTRPLPFLSPPARKPGEARGEGGASGRRET